MTKPRAFSPLRPLLVLTLLALAAPGAAQGPPEGTPPGEPAVAPELVFADSSVEITGVTPGGQVALLSVWREQDRIGTLVTLLDEVLADEDGDGAVTLDLERSVPELSVWAVVDVATGSRRIESPETFEPRRREVRPGRFLQPAGLAEVGVPRAEVRVVRPGEDAFRARLGDGGEDDQDGETDGRVTLSAAQLLRPARRGPGLVEPPLPARFQGGDVVVAIDPRTLETIDLEIPGQPPGGQP
jgi:hypothetical protein